MRKLEIVHRTRYEYAEPVTLGEYRLMFRPRDSHDLRLLQTNLAIEPAAHVRYIHDPFGNSIALASFGEEPVQVLEFVSTMQLEHYGVPPDVPTIEDYARKLPFATWPRRRRISRAMSSGTIPIPTRRSARGRASSWKARVVMRPSRRCRACARASRRR